MTTRQIMFRASLAPLLLLSPVYLCAQDKPLSDKAKIESLIQHVESLKDAVFVRNDRQYDARAAARFLRGKWDAQSRDIKTADDFIDKVASVSSTTGKPYRIRFKDGREVTSREYLKTELQKLTMGSDSAPAEPRSTPSSRHVELIEAPRSVPCFDRAEFVVRVQEPPFKNPFTEAELTGIFERPSGPRIAVHGFADAEDGSIFRLRFCAQEPEVTYRYTIVLRGGGTEKEFTGELRSEPSDRPGAVVVDPEHPKHFIYAASKKPYYHLGYTAYHLLDPSNDLAQIDTTIDYCAKHGFNKIRFLLAGYPRDFDRRTSSDAEFGVRDPWKAPNYGAKPGHVNPLPAWLGKPHAYDFAKFNTEHWRRVDHATRRMRERGIVATAIVTIEKQDLPKEYGRLTEHEYRLYRYAIARLAAFDNVWWDLGNEHNEFRDRQWGDTMGSFVKEVDPYDRLTSAHAYADFLYPKSAWADFAITQQYGDERQVHEWALKYLSGAAANGAVSSVGDRTARPSGHILKPYVNEEYGYEGNLDQPGHGHNADWVRRCHWSIAMAGGYATYGDWSGGVSYFYMGEPGPGQAALQLKHLRTFFESLPFRELDPRDELVSSGFCLASPPDHHIFYFPHGGDADITLDIAPAPADRRLQARWFDPRSGTWSRGPSLAPGKNRIAAQSTEDWALHVFYEQ